MKFIVLWAAYHCVLCTTYYVNHPFDKVAMGDVDPNADSDTYQWVPQPKLCVFDTRQAALDFMEHAPPEWKTKMVLVSLEAEHN